MGCVFAWFTCIVEISNLDLEKQKPVENILVLVFVLQIFPIRGSAGALPRVAVQKSDFESEQKKSPSKLMCINNTAKHCDHIIERICCVISLQKCATPFFFCSSYFW